MSLDFDEILHLLGHFGPYQKFLYSLLCLCMIPACFTVLSPAFVATDVPHVCKIPDDLLQLENISVATLIPYEMQDGLCQPSQCRRYEYNGSDTVFGKIDGNFSACDVRWKTIECDMGWSYDIANYRSSIVTEWDLVCERTWLREVARSSVYWGILVGTMMVSPMADRYGRRLSIFSAVLCNVLFGIGSAFAPTLEVYICFQFLLGCTFVGLYLVTYSYVLEWIGSTKRAFVSNSNVIFYAFAYMGLAGLAYLVRDWRQLSLCLCVPQIFMLFYFWCIPESPRWLLSRGDVKEAEVIILKAARVNKADISSLLPKLGQQYWEEQMKRRNNGGFNLRRKHSFVDLVRTPNLRRRCLNIFCHWTAISLVYYGVSLNISSINGSVYLNFFLAGLVEIPGVLLSVFTVDRYGRTVPLSVFCVIAGVGCICSQVFPESLAYMSVGLALVGKLGAAAAFWTAYIHTSELLPTVIRTTGLGAASCFGRLGSIVAPFVQLLSSAWNPLPFIIYGGTALAASVLILLLPETKGRPLPSTIEDVEYLQERKFSFISSVKSSDSETSSEGDSSSLKKLIMWTSIGNFDFKFDIPKRI
ncbi:organic cation transporter protein-like [Ptychodera flava]|uniref:organic cation transporter protein-like n=1 Tax=Ptychodera flava TaxID=63121 RepID=UPI00396A8DA5